MVTESVAIALINTGGVVVSTTISVYVAAKLPGIRRDAAAAREHSAATRTQVENDHTTNLREESDERHDENRRTLRDILGLLEWLVSRANANREDIDAINERTGQNPDTRRSRRLRHTPPPIIRRDQIPEGTEP